MAEAMEFNIGGRRYSPDIVDSIHHRIVGRLDDSYRRTPPTFLNKVTGIRLKNFKAFKDSGWINFAGINYLMGKNSAGKSSILRAIQFISSIGDVKYEINNLNSIRMHLNIGEYISLGTFDDTVFDGEKEFTIQLKTESNVKNERTINRSYVLSFTFHETQRPKSGNSSNYATIKSFEILDNQASILKIILDDSEKSSFNYGAFLKTLEIKNIGIDIRRPTRIGSRQKVVTKKEMQSYNDKLISFIKKLHPDLLSPKQKIIKFSFSNMKSLDISGHNNWVGFIMGVSISKIIESIALRKLPKNKFPLTNRTALLFEEISAGLIRNPMMRRRLSILRDEAGEEKELYEEFLNIIYTSYMSFNGPLVAMSKALSGVSMSFRYFIKNQNYVEPLRGVTKRKFTINDAGGEVYSSMLREDDRDEKIKYIVKHYLQHSNISDIRVKRSDISDDELEVKLVNDAGKERNIRDFGFGFSQVLPILYKSLENIDFNDKNERKLERQLNSPSPILIIEQPEIHLHPAIQSKLASFFIQVHLDFRKTFIIETHSEHLILSNQVQIKKDIKKAKPTHIHKSSKVIFVNKKKLRGDVRRASLINTIDFKQDGMLSKPFPDDFFDLSMSMYRDLVKPD